MLDWTRCRGHGVCAAAVGERVGLDRWGFPTGVDGAGAELPPALVRPGRLAAASCPAAALRLVRGDGK